LAARPKAISRRSADMTEHLSETYLALPPNDPVHAMFRENITRIGDDFACSYYLSVLTGRNYFVLPLEDARRDAGHFVIEKTSLASSVFFRDLGYVLYFAVPFLKRHFNAEHGLPPEKLNKETQGLLLLLEHPDWSDEQVRQAVHTTQKQMARWSTYNLARIVQRRNSPLKPGERL
jgi:hypothetical protein